MTNFTSSQHNQRHGSRPNVGRCLVRANGSRWLHSGWHWSLGSAQNPWQNFSNHHMRGHHY
jgi:hypothetical protein